MKKVLSILLSVAMIVLCFAACGKTDSDTNTTGKAANVKVGFIFLHDENSTYDKNFINAAEEACKKAGVEILKKTNISETQACYDAAAELVDEGCNIIFADSFGHESYIIQAAKKFPDVQFLHATGTKAHTEGLSNYHNAFASIYEGRYLAGVAAGMKLNEMISSGKITADKAKMGYVGAYTYAEVISGYTSFYLGAKSVCPSVTMDPLALTIRPLLALVEKLMPPTDAWLLN
ncbi:MAG: BMP family ABC transporter substrate-binding protein [Candidatus Fimenecus sp.]|nr:BMP family ABC transporter substrate-binding protein [Candidatus Fimenecus sp.]